MFVHIMKENDSRVALSKERLHLNSDRQQFHEYLQNEQIIEHTHTHTHTHTHEIRILVWDRCKHFGK
jgi:hypothetical protein